LLSAFCSSEFVIVVVIVGIFFDNIQLDGVKAYDLQISSAFFARHNIAFVGVGIDVNISITFGTGSGRHFHYLH